METKKKSFDLAGIQTDQISAVALSPSPSPTRRIVPLPFKVEQHKGHTRLGFSCNILFKVMTVLVLRCDRVFVFFLLKSVIDSKLNLCQLTNKLVCLAFDYRFAR